MKAEYDEILRAKQYYESLIYQKTAELERAKINNQQREKLLASRNETAELLRDIIEYQGDLKRFFEAVNTEDREFKNRRITFINGLITEALSIIFPEDSFRAELRCDFYRKSDVSLVLLDRNGNEMIPDVCSGKLQQYLITFAAISGIARGLGVNNLFVDEAFGVAALDILGDIGVIIGELVKNGMQIIMIAQNPAVYQDIPRREIVMRKDAKLDKVEICSVTDY